MAILDKVLSAGEAVRDKLKETFGEPTASDDDSDPNSTDVHAGDALDLAGAYALLAVTETSTLHDVREAYREKARTQYPLARRDGAASGSQRALNRLLEALELLEEHLVPLSGAPGGKPSAPPQSKRKRATARGT